MTGTAAFADEARGVFEAALGSAATVGDDGFGPLAVDVPADRWADAVAVARNDLGLVFFDWLSAVDEAGSGAGGFRLLCHLARHRPGLVEHLLLRTSLPREAPAVATVTGVFAGAAWHERETHEMFGVDFTRDGEVLRLAPLLLPDEFDGHPLRKDFVLASRVVTPWPGAKDPAGSEATGSGRRRTTPPGVPEPGAWGPRPAPGRTGGQEPDA